ncbi:MAG: hypothetical protein AB1599_10705 [Planctomycetota bacterium]
MVVSTTAKATITLKPPAPVSSGTKTATKPAGTFTVTTVTSVSGGKELRATITYDFTNGEESDLIYLKVEITDPRNKELQDRGYVVCEDKMLIHLAK